MGKKYYRLLLLLLLIVVGAGSYYLWQEQVVARRPFPEGMNVLIKTDYTLCGHQEQTETTAVDLKVSNLRELRAQFLPQRGWESRYEGEQVVVSRALKDLCEKCSGMTHLGEKGGFVAVIKGPAGVDGGIVRVTKIRVNSLPAELRKDAEEGRLDIPDEETLMHILDSLEEDES